MGKDESNEPAVAQPAEETDFSGLKAAELKDELKEADEATRQEIVAAELAREEPRKTVLEAAGVDPNKRFDASGRELHGWEVSPKG